MWLTAIPDETATTLPPQAILVALRRRLRLALPLCPSRCGPNPGCGGTVDAFGDHALASKNRLAGQTCQNRGARLGPSGAGSCGAGRPGSATTVARPHDCSRRAATGPQTPGPRRVWGYNSRRRALLRRDPGAPSHRDGSPSALRRPSVQVDGAALQVAERRKQAAYPELTRRGPQTLLLLGSEIGGRWSTGARRFVRPGPLAGPTRASRRQGRRSVRMGATMVGRFISGGAAVASTALGRPWPAAAQPCSDGGPTLDRVLDLGADAGPSRLPLRP